MATAQQGVSRAAFAYFLTLSPKNWQRYCDRKVRGLFLYDLGDKLCGMCASLALAYGYVQAREHGHDHASAVKEAQKKHVKVRRALGYTYPERGTFDF